MLATNIGDNYQPLSCEVRFYSIKDVQDLTGWSETTVQKLFNDPEFPAADFGKTKLIESHALISYFSSRHERDRERHWRGR